jgi:hypothetical protein
MTEIAPPFTTRLSRDYVPATFEERGATVPFQKPDLANARVRRNAQGELESLVYGFSGGRGVYVLPWRTLPEVLRLNLHDLTLRAEVLTTNAVTPERIQIAAYRVARSGLAGEEMLQDAEDMLADRAGISMATTFHILRSLAPLADLNVNGNTMTPLLLGTLAGKAAARTALQTLVPAVAPGPGPDLIYERLQKTASLVLPLGIDAEGDRGQLRLLFGRVRDFASLVETDAGEGSLLIADAARLTVTIADDLIRQIDGEISKPGALIAAWETRSANLKQTVERLWWLLDGWQPVCDLWTNWSGALTDPMLTLTTLRILPLVPRNEGGRFNGDCASLYHRQSTVFGKLQDEV